MREKRTTGIEPATLSLGSGSTGSSVAASCRRKAHQSRRSGLPVPSRRNGPEGVGGAAACGLAVEGDLNARVSIRSEISFGARPGRPRGRAFPEAVSGRSRSCRDSYRASPAAGRGPPPSPFSPELPRQAQPLLVVGSSREAVGDEGVLRVISLSSKSPNARIRWSGASPRKPRTFSPSRSASRTPSATRPRSRQSGSHGPGTRPDSLRLRLREVELGPPRVRPGSRRISPPSYLCQPPRAAVEYFLNL
jgi:hypothetical protein